MPESRSLRPTEPLQLLFMLRSFVTKLLADDISVTRFEPIMLDLSVGRAEDFS